MKHIITFRIITICLTLAVSVSAAHAYSDSLSARRYVIYMNKAKIAERAGKYEEASMYYRKALETRPSDELAYSLHDSSSERLQKRYTQLNNYKQLKHIQDVRRQADNMYFNNSRSLRDAYQQPASPYSSYESGNNVRDRREDNGFGTYRQNYSSSPNPLRTEGVYSHASVPQQSHQSKLNASADDRNISWSEPGGMWVKTDVTRINEDRSEYMPSLSSGETQEEKLKKQRNQNVNFFAKAWKGFTSIFTPKGGIDDVSSRQPARSGAENRGKSVHAASDSRGMPPGAFDGHSWLELSWEEKINSAGEASRILDSAGVALSGDASDYVIEVNKLLALRPELNNERFEVIFAKAVNVYESERSRISENSVRSDAADIRTPAAESHPDDLIRESEPVRSEGITVQTSVTRAPSEEFRTGAVSKMIEEINAQQVEREILLGSDWSGMDDESRLSMVKEMTVDLHRAGVPLHHTHEQHVRMIGTMISKYPVLQNQPISSIFSRIVNESKPVSSDAAQDSPPASEIKPVIKPDAAAQVPQQKVVAKSTAAPVIKAAAWLDMSYNDKKNYVKQASGLLEQNGVVLSKPHQEYALMLDDFLKKYPSSTEEPLKDVLARVIFVIDPDARKAMTAGKR